VDAVWTWINGSETILDVTRNQVVEAYTTQKKAAGPHAVRFLGSRSTHFRTHGEMINSMRSVLKSMPAALVNKVRGALEVVTRA
jgi:predicted transcriptional regulator